MTGKRKVEFPASLLRQSGAEMEQVSDNTQKSEIKAAMTIDDADFRVVHSNPEIAKRSERLRRAVLKAGKSGVVSRKSGVPASTLHAYITGSEWKVTPALALAEACGVSLEWLVTGHDPEPRNASDTNVLLLTDASGKETLVPSENYAIIPKYDVEASAGNGSVVDREDVVGYMALEQSFVSQVLGRRQQDLVTISATGDSMEPTVHDGDLLFIDTSVQSIQNSRIYVLLSDGVLLVKRLSVRLDGSIDVRSDNSKYEPELIRPTERSTLRIIGQVVYQAGLPRS